MSTREPAELSEEGKRLYAKGRFDEAALLFAQAAEGFALDRAGLLTAEMKNNQSVSLLKAGKPREALEAAQGTEDVFAGAGDKKREAMAIGNVAAALEELDRPDEALAGYERSAALFAEVGEGDLRATVLKSAAAIQLRRGKLAQSGLKMLGALEADERPNLFTRALKSLLRMRK
jgi:tetratricopeptide (TPR) repeat protein